MKALPYGLLEFAVTVALLALNWLYARCGRCRRRPLIRL